MQLFAGKKLPVLIAAALILGGLLGWGVFMALRSPEPDATPPQNNLPAEEEPRQTTEQTTMIGTSVEGRDIIAYQFGNQDAETKLLFVGGIHGGYEWNSSLLAYELIDYLKANPEILPDTISLIMVPAANPDGLYKIINKEGRFLVADVNEKDTSGSPLPLGTGRFNARGVDLNRNFDCKWQPQSSWRGQTVSAGSAPFSEPEAAAIRDLVLQARPAAAIFWHSQANAVYASECQEGILPQTLELMNAYSLASGYPAIDSFDAYPVSGDVEGWLASIGVPAITVELATHQSIDWAKNLAGFTAVLNYYR